MAESLESEHTKSLVSRGFFKGFGGRDDLRHAVPLADLDVEPREEDDRGR